MHNKVLIADAETQTRQAADSLLRQHGFDVISVDSAERAQEVLQFARPDLVIAGGNLRHGEQFFYEFLQSDEKTASLPLLILRPPSGEEPPFPPEVVVPFPIEADDFIQRVRVFIGQALDQQEVRRAAGKAMANLSEDALDAALGLDQLEVEESEQMDSTQLTGDVPTATGGNDTTGMVGYAKLEDTNPGSADSGKVESLMIRESSDQLERTPTAPPKPKPPAEATDYESFLTQLQEETDERPKPAADPRDSAKLAVTETASLVDPVTQAPPSTVSAAPKRKEAGVEKFIDEFKREIEALRTADEGVTEPANAAVSEDEEAKYRWDEAVQSVSREQIDLFTKEVARAVGETIAEKIAAKLDPEKLLQLLRNELSARAKRSS